MMDDQLRYGFWVELQARPELTQEQRDRLADALIGEVMSAGLRSGGELFGSRPHQTKLRVFVAREGGSCTDTDRARILRWISEHPDKFVSFDVKELEPV